MKWNAMLAILALSASIAVADDFKTIKGKEYKNAEVMHVEPDGIVLKTKSGISKVYFTELPKDVQERFHYDPAKAAQFNAATVQQQAPAQAPTQAPARSAENVRTIREVESDQPSFLDQPFMLQGTIEIDNYYNFGYDGAEETHYSFAITDSTGKGCHAYMERANAGDLRERLLSAGSSLKGVFTVVLLSRRYYQSGPPSSLFVELMDYRLEQ